MFEQNEDGEEQIILSNVPESDENVFSMRRFARWAGVLTVVTLIYMAIIHIFPFGIIFEPVSDSILNPLGLGVGTGDQTFGVRVLTSIYSAAVFFLLLDLLWALPKAISYHLAENTSDSRTYHYISVIWRILTSTVIVPLMIVIITTFVASQVSTGEDLWDIMKAGYAGAIIGVYRQFVLAVRKRV